MVQASASASMWVDDEWQANLTRRLKYAVLVSLAVHLGVTPVPGSQELAIACAALVGSCMG